MGEDKKILNLREFLKYKEAPMNGPMSPCNSFLNIVLSCDDKGVSNIYKMTIGRNKGIIDNAVKNGQTKQK